MNDNEEFGSLVSKNIQINCEISVEIKNNVSVVLQKIFKKKLRSQHDFYLIYYCAGTKI